MIEQETPPCALGLESATLSALRDESLPTRELRRLREHTTTCPACQERLAEFERIQRALRHQPELEPGDRIWLGIQERAMKMPGNRHPRPPLRLSASAMRSLAAVASLALVVGLLAIMLANAAGNRGGPAPQPTNTPKPTQPVSLYPPGKPTPRPTPTYAFPTPTFPPTVRAITPSQAWGPNAGQSVNTSIDSSHYFETFSILPDGSSLLGDETATPSADHLPAGTAGLFNLSRRQFTSIGLSQDPSYAVGCCTTDGRYLLDGYDTAPGTTCGSCHIAYYSYDLNTKALWQFASGTSYNMIEDTRIDHGLIIMSTGQGLYQVDLATRQITPIQLHLPIADQSDLLLEAYTWPYIFYDAALSSSPDAQSTLCVHNLSTNQDITLPKVGSLYPAHPESMNVGATVAVTDNTLFIALAMSDQQGDQSTTSLYEDDNFASSSAAPRLLGSIAGALSLTAANDRLVAFGYGPAVVWDRAEQRFVAFDEGGNGVQMISALAGAYLAVIEPFNISPSGTQTPQQVTIFDTDTLPSTPSA